MAIFAARVLMRYDIRTLILPCNAALRHRIMVLLLLIFHLDNSFCFCNFKRKRFVDGTQKMKPLRFRIVCGSGFKPVEMFAMLRKKTLSVSRFAGSIVLHNRSGKCNVAKRHNLLDTANNDLVDDNPPLFLC